MSFNFFCNQCKSFPSGGRHGKRNFWATNCMHIFCESCFRDKQFCKVCEKPCVSLAINNKMPSEVRLFLEPNSVDKTFESLVKVWDYQSQHIVSFGKDERKKEYKKKKEMYVKYQQGLKKLAEVNRDETALIGKLKAAYASGMCPPSLLSARRTSSDWNIFQFNQEPRSAASSSAQKMSRSSSSIFSSGRRSSSGESSMGHSPLPESQQHQQKGRQETKSIIHQTLLNMQKVSLDRQLAQRREQQRKMQWE